ncbi:MAG: hypothetical protein ACRDHP_02270 [Ktedonobacterales bacterium]
MPYPPAFLEIQLLFARRMSDLSGIPYHESLLQNTALYRILGLDWSFDPQDPVWRQFIHAQSGDDSTGDAAYRVYAERYALGLIPDYDPDRPHWGCFSYEYDPDTQAVRLHFAATLDTTGLGPLSSGRKEARVAELHTMFAHILATHPDAECVKGGTWLYNRAEYTRLFPKEYGESAQTDHPHLIARAVGPIPATRESHERRGHSAVPGSPRGLAPGDRICRMFPIPKSHHGCSKYTSFTRSTESAEEQSRRNERPPRPSPRRRAS